jgi:hypothetical protein
LLIDVGPKEASEVEEISPADFTTCSVGPTLDGSQSTVKDGVLPKGALATRKMNISLVRGFSSNNFILYYQNVTIPHSMPRVFFSADVSSFITYGSFPYLSSLNQLGVFSHDR